MFICGAAPVVVACAGAGWPVIAAIVAPAFADALDLLFLDFFFSCWSSLSVYLCRDKMKDKRGNNVECRHTSCHPQSGLNESKNPTSSNRLGYNHNPGGVTNMVIPNKIRRKIDMAKNKPIRPSIPMERYQTPSLIFIGQRGNITMANTTANAPAAYSFIFIWLPSYNQAKYNSSLHSCCCSIFTVHSPFTLFVLAGGAWPWPSWGSILETRSARRESGRSLKVFSRDALSVISGRRGFLDRALVYASDCRARSARFTALKFNRKYI